MSDTQNLIENRPPSVATLFLERVAATPDAEAYRYPGACRRRRSGPDEWRSLSWGQAAERVYAIAAGLIELGVRPEERVALASSTRVEWILADLGVLCAGAATTTVYPQHQRRGVRPSSSPTPSSRVLIAEDAAPARQGAGAARRTARPRPCRGDRGGRRGARRGRPGGLGALPRRSGGARRGVPASKNPGRVKERSAALTADQLATLIYTSGTTGRPKGVRLAHDAWSYMARAIEPRPAWSPRTTCSTCGCRSRTSSARC